MSLGGCLYTQEDEEDKEDEDEENWETDSNASADSSEEYVFIGTRWVLRALSLPALSSEAEADAVEAVEQEAEAEEPEEEPKEKIDVSKPLVAPLFALPCGFEFPECAICYEKIDMVNVTVTTCGHTFHSSCAFKALENKDCCPMCRHQLVEEAESEGEYEESVDEGESEDGSDNGEDEDDESEADDFKVNLEQLAGKVTNMGYTMHDILKFFVSDIKSGTNEQRYSEEFFDKMEQDINGVILGTISLAHRDARSYAAVASVASMASVAAAPKVQAQAPAVVVAAAVAQGQVAVAQAPAVSQAQAVA
jgi:hypothetical protein